MKSKIWLIGWFLLVVIALGEIGNWVYKVDPYFHYHKPEVSTYFYSLDNQRSQNNGISKHFEYDAIITGTSMTENFKTSEVNKIFNVNSVKVPYSGASYQEINSNLSVALKHNPNLKMIIRCLDYEKIFDDKDLLREDLGTYPKYLYDNNIFNDVKYLFNKEIIFNRVYEMAVTNEKKGVLPGITSFDNYSKWQNFFTFGKNSVVPDGVGEIKETKPVYLTEQEKIIIKGNITQNVTALADEYPNVDFYCFFSPYSAVWWKKLADEGTVYKQIEAERYVIELILEHENIHLYSFNNRTDITTDLNHYKDITHYGQWINSLMLQWMYEGEYLLTKENYQNYLEEELAFYTSFDYMSLNSQEDYESDYYAAAIINNELTGAETRNVLEEDLDKFELANAEVIEEQYEGGIGIQCSGRLQRNVNDANNLETYVFNTEYIGGKLIIDDIGAYNYLAFQGRKIAGQGQPSVFVYNRYNDKVGGIIKKYDELDNEWHQYIINLSDLDGPVTIIFNGGYEDNTGSLNSAYVFSEIKLY